MGVGAWWVQIAAGPYQQGTMDKGLPPVTQLPSPKLGRIRHTTAEWGTVKGSQHPTSTKRRGEMNQSR